MRAPLPVSIVVPTLGRERVLVETLDALLRLDPPADEILVADQTPRHEPETEDFLRSAAAAGRIRLLPPAPPGVVRAMNHGLRAARNEHVLFLDDDLVPSPGLVAAHRDVYERYPDCWAVAGRVSQPGDADGDAGPADGGAAERDAGGDGGGPRAGGLRAGLDFDFNGTRPAWAANVMAGNLSVVRRRALEIGGFDERFLPPVSYRFETEFAKRILARGGRIRFEPSARVRHLRAPSGGTRSLGSHLASASPLHGVGDYYYALRCGRGWDRARYLLRRPFREVRTRFHLRHPWWIPVKFVGEWRALALALRLYRRAGREDAACSGS